MSIKQGATDIVDRYVGGNLVERVYQGSDLVFDAYSEVTGNLPMTFNSRVPGALKNYTLYGTAAGAGVATESGEPAGYKIPILNMSGVTENEFPFAEEKTIAWGNATIISDGKGNFSINGSVNAGYSNTINLSTPYTIPTSIGAGGSYCFYVGNSGANPYIILEFYDENGSNIESWALSSVWRKSTTYSNMAGKTIAKIGFQFYGSEADVNITVSPMFSKNASLTEYIPHRYQSNYDLMIGSTKLGEEEYVDYGEQKVYKRTENLFDKNAKDTDNGYIDGKNIGANGVTGDSQESAVSEYIPATAGANYLITGNNTQNLAGSAICFYNASKQYISGQAYNYTNPVIAEAPNNAAFLRFTIRKLFTETAMLIEGSTVPQSYIPYLQPTDPPVPLPAINAYQGENTLSSTETVGNVTVKGRIAPMYRQVGYLKSTGTQVIDTDIPIDSFDEKIDIDVQFGSALSYSGISDVNRAICGTSNPMFVAYCKTASVEFYLGYGWSSSLQTSTYIIQNPSYSSRKHLVLKRGGSTWGSSSVPANATISQTIPGLYALAFFGGKTSNGVIGAYKVFEASIYSVKIYDSSNNVVHDIIPAERYDGVLGLYDKSTAKFYTNVGEGTFIKGGYVT